MGIEQSEIRRVFYLYLNLTEQSQCPNLIFCGISDTVVVLTFTRIHANSIFKVVEEKHLTKKQECGYTFSNVYFPLLC